MPSSTTAATAPTLYERWRDFLLGPPRDPLNPETRHHIVLMAFFAWIGLGADGLSSSAYGPEEAFKALGSHTHLSLYLALATAATVFIISLAYNQVIELFPSGGGGYKVATQLIGPHAGLVSGSALIVDYVLTIAISIASGVDAIFSLLPTSAQAFKLGTEIVCSVLLIYLNLRGMKESIKVLTPIFLGFVVIHVVLILYGVFAHGDRLPQVVTETVRETSTLSQQMGWLFVASLFLRAYSLGGGTYTGIEAVSNNINMLREPRVRTGKLTMFMMAVSLAFTAGGIIALYLLWDAKPSAGETLNAVVFKSIIDSFGLHGAFSQGLLIAVLALEGALLFVAANTGLLGGPAVLANMAVDQWVPNHFSSLSSRLVTKNGIVVMGLAALAILYWSNGAVDLLVVLYSINVFLTFSLSLYGLCVYWLRRRSDQYPWRLRFALSAGGLVVTGGILLVTVSEKFFEGGWVTLLITSAVIGLCLLIKRHYMSTRSLIKRVDETFGSIRYPPVENPPPLDPTKPTAIFMVSRSRGAGMHTILWVQRLFPGNFKNFVFLGVGTVDTGSYGGEGAVDSLQEETHEVLKDFVNFCHHHSIAATSYESYGIDRLDELRSLTMKAHEDFPDSVFFASKLVFVNDRWYTRWLHNQTPLSIQRFLHLQGIQMVILPMKV